MEQVRRNNNGNYNENNQYSDNNNDIYINNYIDDQLNDNQNYKMNTNDISHNTNINNQNNNQYRNQHQNSNQSTNENSNSSRSNNNVSQNQNSNKNLTASQEDINFLELNAAQILDLLKQNLGASRRMSGTVLRTENYLNELSQFSSTLGSITTATSQSVTREEFGKAINYLYGAIAKESANNQLIINQLKQVSAQLQAFATSNQINQRTNTNQIGTNTNAKAQEADSNYIEIPLPKIGKVKVDVKFVKTALIAVFFIFTVLVLLMRR